MCRVGRIALRYCIAKGGLEEKFEQVWCAKKTSQADATKAKDVPSDDATLAASSMTPMASTGSKRQLGVIETPKPASAKRGKAKATPEKSSQVVGKAALVKTLKEADKKKQTIMLANSAKDVIELIKTDNTWEWARNAQNLGAIETMFQELKDSKTDFVLNWLAVDAANLKSMYDAAKIETELADSVPRVEAIAQKLNDKLAQLNRMRRACSGN